MDLIRDPIPGLVRRIAVPASLGFLFHTMYNVVDTWFAGTLPGAATEAQAALAMSFPVFFIILALGSGLSQGTTALIANAVGGGKPDEAHHLTLQSFSFAILLGASLMPTGFLSCRWLFAQLGAQGPTLDFSMDYMGTILLGTVFFLLQGTLNASLQARGDTRSQRNVLFVGVLLNMELNACLMMGVEIAGVPLIPAMGIRGIAWATVLIEALGCVYLARRLVTRPEWIGWSALGLIPRAATFREIARQGLPAGLNMSTVALGIFIITGFIARFSSEGVAAYGIATRVEQIALLPSIGLNIAVMTLVGQNNGAGRLDRVRAIWTTTLRYGLIMMVIGGLGIAFLAERLMRLFTSDPMVIRLGADYLHVAAITLCAYIILFQTVFLLQGLKRPMFGLWMGLYRQILAPFLVFWFLAFHLGWGLPGIWWGIFLVTWSAALFTLAFGSRTLRLLESQDS